jgi:predicted dehydrogenase
MKRRVFHSLAIAAGVSRLMNAEGTSTAPRIKIGQIGTRHTHASGQFEALRQCGDYEIVGVVEPDEAQRAKMEKSSTYAGVRWMSEEELLNTPGLQAVGVETEVGQLLNQAEKVVNAGLHLQLDKPPGESLPQFKRILDTAAAKKRLVKVGYMFRFNPAFQFSIKAARDGWLGQVFSVHAEMRRRPAPPNGQGTFPTKAGLCLSWVAT